MHEIGLVSDILSVINAKLKKIGQDSKVRRINIVIGELEHITPQHFEFHFREHTKGTHLENSELSFKKIQPRFLCKDCKYEFSAEQGLKGCPKCNSKVIDVVAGRGIHVESVEVF